MDKDFQTFEEKYMDEHEGEIVSVYDRHAGLVDGAKWGIDHVKKSQEILHDSETSKENGNSLTCDDLERKAVGVGLRFRDELICDGVSREAAEIYAAIAQQKFMDGAKWQEEKDKEILKEEGLMIVPDEQFETMKRSLIKLSEEKEQMMKNAIDTTIQHIPNNYGEFAPCIYAKVDSTYNEGDKVKVLVIKKEQNGDTD